MGTMNSLVLSLFPGLGLLDRAFEEQGFCIVRGPDLLWGGDVRRFHPPAGKFDGIIGGPPCQAHSNLARLNERRGVRRKPDLIPEFARCVEEAAPNWFLMENVPAAPDPECPSYGVHRFVLNNRDLGAEQNRRRSFWFGLWGRPPIELDAFIERAEPNKEWVSTVCASGIRKPGTESERGHKFPAAYGWSSWANLRKALVWQGLPADYLAHAPLTLKGAFQCIGNGVPLPMGRAVASAVRRALEEAQLCAREGMYGR